MTYCLKPDEVAFLIKPTSFDDDGNWTGEIATGIATHKDNTLEKEGMSYLIDLITLMSAFIDVIQYDNYVYKIVEQRRNELVDLETSNKSSMYETVEGTNGKVLKLTAFTKTEGNA